MVPRSAANAAPVLTGVGSSVPARARVQNAASPFFSRLEPQPGSGPFPPAPPLLGWKEIIFMCTAVANRIIPSPESLRRALPARVVLTARIRCTCYFSLLCGLRFRPCTSISRGCFVRKKDDGGR